MRVIVILINELKAQINRIFDKKILLNYLNFRNKFCNLMYIFFLFFLSITIDFN